MSMALAGWLWRAQLRAQPGRLLAATLAIAIGVALALAIHLVNRSALAEFDAALAVVNGEAQARIEGRAGSFDESLWPRIAAVPEIVAASPVVESVYRVTAVIDAEARDREARDRDGSDAGVGRAEAIDSPSAAAGESRRPAFDAAARDDGFRLRVIGIDVLRIPDVTPDLMPSVADTPGAEGAASELFADDAIFPTPRALELLGAKLGDTLELASGGRTVALRIAGTADRVPSDVVLAVMDIGTMQWRLGWLGRLTRIDLRLAPGLTVDAIADPARLGLPDGVSVEAPQAARQRMSNLSRAYRVNLNVLALVALFTGGFIVHATMSLAVARQQGELALLGVLGAGRGFVLRQALGLGVLTGLAGAVLGIACGIAGARILLAIVGGDLGGGYFAGSAPSLTVDARSVFGFGAAGLLTALAGSLGSASRIAGRPPAQALRGGSVEDLLAGRAPLAVPLALLAVGALLLVLPPIGGLPLPAYLSIALWLIGGIALVRHGVAGAAGLLRHDALARAGPAAWLAAQRIASSPGGTGAALGGIVAAVALASAMAIMVTSFRSSVDDWLDTVLPADLYASIDGSAADAGFDRDAQKRIAATVGVARAEFLRATRVSLDTQRPPVVVLARPIDATDPQRRLPITGRLVEAPAGSVPIWVSEAVAEIYGWTPGRQVSVPLPQRADAGTSQRSDADTPQRANADTPLPASTAPPGHAAAANQPRFHVAGVWRDYGRQHGAIAIDLADWQRLTGDRRITDIALWLAEGADADDVATRLRAALGEHEQLRLRSAAAIRETSLRIFDRSFAVTWALEAVAIAVALFGVASAWATEAIARTREFGMLRHLGQTPAAIVSQFAIEAGALVSVAVGWGLALGAAIALVLVHRVNPQSFHWTMDTRWPLAELLVGGLALIVLAVLVATVAARQVGGAAPVRAVREDW